MARLQVAIVGAGLMGKWHAIYASRVGGRIAAIIDQNVNEADALARRFPKAATFANLERCLEQLQIDVVHICTNTASHAALAQTALEAGKHVLIEKPVTTSIDEAHRLVTIAEANQLHLCPIHQFVFQDGFRRLQKSLPTLGNVDRVMYRVCSAGGATYTNEERRELLLEILPHAVALISRVGIGEFGEYRWRVLRWTSNALDIVGQANDVLVDISISLRGRPTKNELYVVGSNATAMTDLFHGYSVREGGRVSRAEKILRPFNLGRSLLTAASVNLLRRVLLRQPAYPGLCRLISEIYCSISDNLPPPVDDNAITTSAEFISLVRRSAAATSRERGGGRP